MPVDATVVLWGQALTYTLYALAVLLVIGSHVHVFWAQLLGGIGMGTFMAMAGLQGMLPPPVEAPAAA